MHHTERQSCCSPLSYECRGRPRADDVFVRGSDQPERGSGLIASSALLVSVVAFG